MNALERLNRLPAADAAERLRDGCGAWRWAATVAAARPFDSREELFAAAESAFDVLTPDDWLEAFASHPRIGEAAARSHQSGRGKGWSEAEQRDSSGASADVKAALADGNRRYAERFGFTYIVCATGKSAEEMLARLETRLGNDSARELQVAADEQRKITRLRLDKMLAGT